MGGVAVRDQHRRVGLVYVARVSLINDFAVGVTSYATGEFIPYRGYLGGGAIYGHGRVVHDRTRPAISDGWKVGFTTNLPQRIVDLAGNVVGGVEVVALRSGPRAYETDAHRSLRDAGAVIAPEGPRGHHSYGCAREWYRDSAEFRAWLNRYDASWRGSIAYQPHCGDRVTREAQCVEAILVGTMTAEVSL
mgnify:CR=1 FL=1